MSHLEVGITAVPHQRDPKGLVVQINHDVCHAASNWQIAINISDVWLKKNKK
jgi:hypothetical protein